MWIQRAAEAVAALQRMSPRAPQTATDVASAHTADEAAVVLQTMRRLGGQVVAIMTALSHADAPGLDDEAQRLREHRPRPPPQDTVGAAVRRGGRRPAGGARPAADRAGRARRPAAVLGAPARGAGGPGRRGARRRQRRRPGRPDRATTWPPSPARSRACASAWPTSSGSRSRPSARDEPRSGRWRSSTSTACWPTSSTGCTTSRAGARTGWPSSTRRSTTRCWTREWRSRWRRARTARSPT